MKKLSYILNKLLYFFNVLLKKVLEISSEKSKAFARKRRKAAGQKAC